MIDAVNKTLVQSAVLLAGLLLVGFVLLAEPTYGQGVALPSMLPPNTYQGGTIPPPSTSVPPGVVLDGNIQPLHQQFDPYGDCTPPPVIDGGFYPEQGVMLPGQVAPGPNPINVCQRIGIEGSWVWGDSGQELGITSAEIFGTFAVPMFHTTNPFTVTPGFGLHMWDGPVTGNFASMPDLPGETYDAYLELGWRPQVTSWLSFDLAFKPGVFTDFDTFNDNSLRFLGRGVGMVSLSSQFQVLLGAEYLDRIDIKLLPVAGFIWMPTLDQRYEIVFPHPKASWRLFSMGNNDVWWYIRGELGGGSWTIERASGASDAFDYQDLRVAAGFEWTTYLGGNAFFEVGYAFDRKVKYLSGVGDFDPDDTFLLRGGVYY